MNILFIFAVVGNGWEFSGGSLMGGNFQGENFTRGDFPRTLDSNYVL